MKFESIEPLFAEVKEDLSSYFNTGAVDDILFPRWSSYCLKRFEQSAKISYQTAIPIKNHQGTLPDDLQLVKEAWICNAEDVEFVNPSYTYYQADCRITPSKGRCDTCNCPEPFECTCDPCAPKPKDYLVTHKVTGVSLYRYHVRSLLKPSKYAKDKCHGDSPNLHCHEGPTFDISGCTINTSTSSGIVHLVYYADALDAEGNQMVPEDIYVQEYIKKYLKYKVFEKLLNSTTDESLNQVMMKYQLADSLQKQAFTQAEMHLKKRTTLQNKESIQANKRRFNRLVRRHY